ncbi:MAG: DEAD/DEAH box helicase family protein [Candidatus Thiothrix moscowensis]|nr:DEAD/DEAH box helicase family protein [Candidatus Thiothrix moscowensis]
MSFHQINLRSTYCSEVDSLLSDFYIPALSNSISYNRAVGFFSSTMLTYALQGLDGFIRNNGYMRLIIGEEVTEEEYHAIKQGHDLSVMFGKISVKWDSIIASANNDLLIHRLNILSWMVANGRLEIKYALRRKGMYHEKIGIMKDSSGECLVFQGSANETTNALLPDLNFESISVYPSWKIEIFEEYAKPYIQRFDRLWNNESKNTVTVPIPSSHYDQIRQFYKRKERPEYIEEEVFDSIALRTGVTTEPKLPISLGGNFYKLHEHQKEALQSWLKNDFSGIMALATGAGKTITAIHAAVQIANSSKETKLAVIVAVPYQILADQWCDVFSLFNISPIQCYRSKIDWLPVLDKEISDFNLLRSKRFMAVVVVNKTLIKEDFQKQMNRIKSNNLYFIGDECHHHGNERTIPKLPQCRFRMGLSATPWAVREDERRNYLVSYYGQKISSYTIDQAIKEEVLTPYQYHMHLVSMNDVETENYQELTLSINRLIAIRESGGSINKEQLDGLMRSRTRLLGSLEDKFSRLGDILDKFKVNPHTLFYCGDGSTESDDYEGVKRDVERAAKILDSHGWKTSRFTAEETPATRQRILENFREAVIDGIVAIRVLDEGFDVPACRTAFLLASSRNERQFIQRRGRILRRSLGKEYSIIHDFIVFPSHYIKNEIAKDLVEKELSRAGEFIRVASNRDDLEHFAQSLGERYGIDFESVRNTYVDLEA